jgi:hypothetical protein
MSSDMPDFLEFPKIVSAGTRSTAKYHLVTSHFAVHGRPILGETEPTMEFVPEGIAVYPIHCFGQVEQTSAETSPVYSLQPDGLLAVPTGRVFVRMRPDVKFADHERDFRDAGYEIDQMVPYAPNAGWLRPLSSSIASSLRGLDNLSLISGVENTEPQMLQKAVRKA